MAWKARRGTKWNWRAFLTPEEAAWIKKADGEIARLTAELRTWTQPRQPIVNRAIHRAKYTPTVPHERQGER